MATKNKKPLVVIGTGGHAKVVADVARVGGQFKVIGYLDIGPSKDPACQPLLGQLQALSALKRKYRGLVGFIAIGDNAIRRRVSKELEGMIRFATIIHRQSVVGAQVTIGEGSVVMAGAILNPGVRVETHCVINTGSIVEHDCVLGHFSSVGPGAVLGGGSVVGQMSAIGLGAVVLHGIHIQEASVVGAGAVVTKNVPKNVVTYGVPAKKIRERKSTDPYL